MRDIAFTDQLASFVHDIFQERGYNVKVSLPEPIPGGKIYFEMDPIGCELNQELVDSVIDEALKRQGCEER